MTSLVLFWKKIDDIRYLSLFHLYICELLEVLSFLSLFIWGKRILNWDISLGITTLLQHDTQFFTYLLNSEKVEIQGRKKYQGKEQKLFLVSFPLDYYNWTVFVPQLHLTPCSFPVARGRVKVILIQLAKGIS